jgi:predicted ribosome quality control (RQC) complex YloA/Tae2 family protein
MFNSWFHIRLIAKYFQENLIGSSFGKPFTYEKGKLHLPIYSSEKIIDIHFSIQQPLPFLNISKAFREPQNKVFILSDLEGKQITNVKWHKSDRQILIELNKGKNYLLFQVFGINGNVLYLNDNFEIMDIFKKRKKISIPQKDDFVGQDKLIIDQEKFINSALDNQNRTVSKFLSSYSLPIYSKTLIKEICYRAKIDPSELIANLKNSDLNILKSHFQEIISEIDNPNFIIYFSEPPIFSFTKLYSMSTVENEIFNDFATATQAFISTYFKWRNFTEKKKYLTQKIEGVISSLQRKLDNQKRDYKKIPTSDKYHQWADTILTNLNKIDKNKTNVVLPKIDNPSEDIIVPLNPNLTLAENAKRYYDKSRKIKEAKKNLLQSMERAETSLQEAVNLIAKFQNATQIQELKKIEKQLSSSKLITQSIPQYEVEHLPYYKFNIDNWEVLVGKSAKDNDVLTFKVAIPNDFWFHAENVSGSHVVLRNPRKSSSLPKNIIEKTAGIAAYYSKAKHSKYVPVIYTLRKYIWKRKGSTRGMVSVKYEKSVIVEPYKPN